VRVVSPGSAEAGTEPADALVAGVLAGAEGQATASLAGVSFADLCRRLDGLAPREPGAARN